MRAWAPRPDGGVGVEPEDRHRRQALGQQRLDLLGADPGPGERGRVALSAGPRQRLAVGAVVADEAPDVAVDDQRDVAVGAVPVMATGAAGEPGSEAAAVDHHDRLGPGGAHALQRVPGLGVQGAAARVGLAHVEHPHRRHRPTVDAPRQIEAGQLEPGLGPRRGGAGDEHGAALGGPPAGDRAGVVAGVSLLLVGGVVLLVDHDQAELAQRREDGRAGTDADAGLAASQSPPLVVALARGESRVQDGEAIAEPRPEACHRLRRQADLRHQHDRPLAARQGRLDRGEVDLGLARAGDAVQELLARRPRFAVEGGDDALDRGLLLGQQPGPAAAAADLRVDRAPPHRGAAGGDQAALLEPAQHAAIRAHRRGKLRRRHLPGPQRLQDRSLLDPQSLSPA